MERTGAARKVEELAHDLLVWTEGDPPVVDVVLPRLAELLGAERACAYGVRKEDEGPALDFLRVHAYPSARLTEDWDELVRSRPGGWGGYNPTCPEPWQRNRPSYLPWTQVRAQAERCAPFQRVIERHSILREVGNLRVLACDGSALLAWVGVFRPDCTQRELGMFEGVAPALVRRLRLERKVAVGGLALAALDALLEQVPGAAFLVDRRGRVVHANTAAGALLAREGAATTAAVAAVARGGARKGYQVLGLKGSGLPTHFLVLQEAPEGAAAAPAARMAKRLRLTARQHEVLCRLAAGSPNKTIAAELDIAERTVEQHVSALLARAGCGSRSQLVAALWTQS